MLHPHTDTADDFQRALQLEQVLAHGRSLAVLPLASGAVALGLVTILWPQPSVPALLGWLAAVAITLCLRFVVHWRVEREWTVRPDPARWLQWHRIAAGCNGLAWMALTFVMQQLPRGPTHDTIVFALAVLLAGSVMTNAFDRLASLLFALPVSVPAALHALLHHAHASPMLVGMAVLFGLTLVAVGLQGFRVFRGQIRRRLDLQRSVEQAQRDAQRLERVGGLARIGAWEFSLREQTLNLSSQTRLELGLSEAGAYTIEAVLERIDPAHREPLRSAFQDSIERQQAFSLEVRTVEADSTHGQLLVVGRPVVQGTRVLRVEGAVQDITRYIEMDQALSRSRSELQAVLQMFPGLISAIDEGGRYVYVNAPMAQTLGRPAAEILGQTVENLLDPAHAARLRSELPTLSDEPRSEVVRLPAAPGCEPQVVQITRVAGQPDRGGQRRYYAFGFDITELERTQQQLRQAKDEAEQASRAKSQFLSQMSHELRTPLNAILGFGQLLGSDPQRPLAQTQRAQLQEMMTGAQHLLNLINGLLDLGRIESGHLALTAQPVALAGAVREALALMRTLADRQGVQLCQDCTVPEGLSVHADRTRLLQVLLNLLANAIKYNRPGGEVTVVWSREGAQVRLGVRDNGPGLRPEALSRLFQPFERLGAEHTAIEGTGIGLALSRRLMQAMGGDIEVDSLPGQGSTFWLRMPAVDAGTDVAIGAGDTSTERPPPVVPLNDRDTGAQAGDGTAPAMTVLCIEDNPVNLLVLEAMLSRVPGLEMLRAETSESGLEQARTAQPDLILTDIQMPGMDGFELMARLQADPLTRHIPVAAISADALPASVERGRAAGFIDYLTKPVEMAELHALLRRTGAPARPA
ncbi:MAG: PAS domain-containing hybrid sensor histidine kinase/response regulator [Rubrivivax sp.]